jgi:hypothetical protein
MYHTKIKPDMEVPIANKTERTSAAFIHDAIMHMNLAGIIDQPETLALLDKVKSWQDYWINKEQTLN